MSYVPNDILYSSDSLDLSTFEIKLAPTTSPFIIDIFNERLAFWKNLVLRNQQSTTSIFYRLKSSGPFQELQPASERPIKGWGSYFEFTSTDIPVVAEIDFVCVKKENAVRQ